MLKSEGNPVSATMLQQVEFQLDTDAEIHTISIDFVDQGMISPASASLVTWKNKSSNP